MFQFPLNFYHFSRFSLYRFAGISTIMDYYRCCIFMILEKIVCVVRVVFDLFDGANIKQNFKLCK
jgi:hypothetical protein